MKTSTEPTAEGLWNAISDKLREVLSETSYDTWLAHAEPQSLAEHRLVVAVPNEFTRDWIESHFRGFVSAAAREGSGRDDLSVSFVVGDRPVAAPTGPPPQAGTGARAREPELEPHDSAELGLNQKYTFDLSLIHI